jgi:hypothetical protein
MLNSMGADCVRHGVDFHISPAFSFILISDKWIPARHGSILQ